MEKNSTFIHSKLYDHYKDKVILITGGTGSIGSQIVCELVKYSPNKIIILSKDDTKQYLMKQRFKRFTNIYYLLGDIRDYQRVEYVSQGVDFIFHSAALKQVPTCEENPDEAIKTNLLGSLNIIEAAIKNKVKKVINISTDKAVNPTNTMGVTKLLAEKLFTQANFKLNNQHTKFSSVRFGNVLGSRGSIIPLLMDQLLNQKPLTITDLVMTRFFMSIKEAVQLTIQAGVYAEGGEIYILKMKALKLSDLVDSLIVLAKQKKLKEPEVQIIGKRPGEKLFEELASEYELNNMYENDEMYVISSRPLSNDIFKKSYLSDYRSDKVNLINQVEILHILKEHDRQ
ncbi:SDR family NAD(P)-dependent oxidoreductase [Peribacillus frigoritolerans]|uniref:SDR family NAD(P)-dependent oxidoreductase n=1 Tax=Peribacillus frigoritolerans TaxID=450367 RepID=UPI002079DE01|nr:SDR family NAD(P)-dependent oxidoreductase [Peribacillus frigoritolerans]USK72895.1 SDR family NAD(P)-dependent oxidoreductase [Peribacillus frigoritolerans]